MKEEALGTALPPQPSPKPTTPTPDDEEEELIPPAVMSSGYLTPLSQPGGVRSGSNLSGKSLPKTSEEEEEEELIVDFTQVQQKRFSKISVADLEVLRNLRMKPITDLEKKYLSRVQIEISEHGEVKISNAISGDFSTVNSPKGDVGRPDLCLDDLHYILKTHQVKTLFFSRIFSPIFCVENS